jgi:hypothetical protein
VTSSATEFRHFSDPPDCPGYLERTRDLAEKKRKGKKKKEKQSSRSIPQHSSDGLSICQGGKGTTKKEGKKKRKERNNKKKREGDNYAVGSITDTRACIIARIYSL